MTLATYGTPPEQAKATRNGRAVQHEGGHQRREGRRQNHAVAPATGSPLRGNGEFSLQSNFLLWMFDSAFCFA